MCGIAGVFHADPRAVVDADLVRRMAERVRHRGPDGASVRAGPGYGLGHRRLSIIDVAGGAQPMDDGSGRLWVVFNGEIYNYRALRRELEQHGYRFHTQSDTEVLLHGYREWGTGLPARLNGMFAFVVADERTHQLFAARDRLGKKPLHYAVRGEVLVFGSELKALLVHPDVRPALRPDAIAKVLCLRYLPDPDAIYAGVAKLPPAHWLRYERGRVEVQPYWRLSFAPSAAGDRDLREDLLGLLDDAVRIRLMSEVPLGAFLSGGIDSYAVVEAMSRAGPQTVTACAVGFDEPRFDELPHARAAAAACRAALHEEVVRVDDMLEQDWFADTFDEPFADSSAIPTHRVSRMARRHVTVALSGDGGDEAFAGYRRYRFDWNENRARAWLPQGLWAWLGRCYPKADFLPRWLRFKRTLQNLACAPAEAYARSVCANLPEQVLPLLRPPYRDADPDPLQAVRAAYLASDAPDPLARAAAADYATWLPGDVLAKVDRASMAVSLEVRAPFLDHRVVELAASVPSRYKLHGHQTKGFLRRALPGRLEPGALARRKQGFSVPLRRWMAGPLGAALERALDGDRLRTIVEVERVRPLLAQHRRGVSDQSELLWALLVLDRFLARWQPAPA